jgi:parallel beta-helix repeat protein
MIHHRHGAIGVAIFATLSHHAAMARDVDNGDKATYSKQVYVDNAATRCVAVGTCGTQSRPFTDLVTAITVLKPGTELIIAGTATPYYGTPTGALPVDPAKPTAAPNIKRGVISLGALRGSETQAPTLIRKWSGTPNPVIRGSLKVTGWTQVDNSVNKLPSYTYSRKWTLTNTDAFGTNSTRVVEPQQVFNGFSSLLQIGGTPFEYKFPAPAGSEYSQQEAVVNGPLWRGYVAPDSVNPQYKLNPNEFYYDVATQTLYVRLQAPMPSTGLEVSTYQHILFSAESPFNIYNITIQDIDFERSNTSGYSRGGAVSLLGKNITLNRIAVRQADAACVGVTGVNFTIRNSTFEYCGQTGIAAAGQKGLITENIVRKNNQRHFNSNWEAGGMKLIGGGSYLFNAQKGVEPNPLPFINGVDNSTISRNRVYDNTGPDRTAMGRPAVTNNEGHGIWLDTDNNDNVITDNVIAYNGVGLFLEINARNKITRNQIFGNVAQGIQFKESDSTLSDNWIIGNLGFGLLSEKDSRNINPTDVGYQPYRNTFTNNRFAWNGQVTVSNPLEIRLVVDPANPVTNKLTASGNRYCSNYQYYELKKVSGSDLASVNNNQLVDSLSAWNSLLNTYGAGQDASAQLITIPASLRTALTSKSEALVNTAYNGQVLSASQAADCLFPAR